MMVRASSVLEGWKEIADFLEQLSGKTRSRWTLRRLAKHKPDALPVYLFGPSGERVHAEREAIRNWWRRHRHTY